MNGLEIFGYLASAVIAASLMMSSIVKLRWVNLLGAAMFSIYGLLISAPPVAALNGFIVLVNLYHLYGIYRQNERFHLLQARLEDPLVRYWLDYHREDIHRFFPGLNLQPSVEPECHLIVRNSEPVGMLLGRQRDRIYEVTMDYAFPPYQDFRTGNYLYRQSGFFSARGVHKVVAHAAAKRHQAYLARMGFRPSADDDGLFEYRLTNA